MSLSAAEIAFLADAGLSIHDVVEFARLRERSEAPMRSAAAERQARYRARTSVTRDVTSDDDVTSRPSLSPSSSSPPTPPLITTTPNPPQDISSPEKPKANSQDAEVTQAVQEYNRAAADFGLPVAKSIPSGRRAAISARLRDGGLEGWREALADLAISPHCLGQNDRGWKADIDFVASPKGFAKLREGAYRAKGTGPPASPGANVENRNALIRAFRSTGIWHAEWGDKPEELTPKFIAPEKRNKD